MHSSNKTRDGKGLLKLWRSRPDRLLHQAGKSFSSKMRETIRAHSVTWKYPRPI